jgi:hypothetical protein
MPERHVLPIDNPEDVPFPVYLTRREVATIQWLHELASAAYQAMDNTETFDDEVEQDGAFVKVERYAMEETDFKAICTAMDALDLLPDDQPGYTMTPNAKARWALRRLVPELSPHTIEPPPTEPLIAAPIIEDVPDGSFPGNGTYTPTEQDEIDALPDPHETETEPNGPTTEHPI